VFGKKCREAVDFMGEKCHMAGGKAVHLTLKE